LLKARNLLIFRDAKNAKNGKIAANWNVSGTRDFSFAEQNSRLLRFICFRVAYHLEIITSWLSERITGFNKPSKTNEEAFQAAIEEIAKISGRLIHSLETTAPPKNREDEATRAKARAAARFGD